MKRFVTSKIREQHAAFFGRSCCALDLYWGKAPRWRKLSWVFGHGMQVSYPRPPAQLHAHNRAHRARQLRHPKDNPTMNVPGTGSLHFFMVPARKSARAARSHYFSFPPLHSSSNFSQGKLLKSTHIFALLLLHFLHLRDQSVIAP